MHKNHQPNRQQPQHNHNHFRKHCVLILLITSIVFFSCASPKPEVMPVPYANQTFPPKKLSKQFLYEDTNAGTLMKLMTAFTDDYVKTDYDTREINIEDTIIKGTFLRNTQLDFTREDNKNILFRPIYEYTIQIKAQSLSVDIVFVSSIISINEEVFIFNYIPKNQARIFQVFNEYGLALLNSTIRDDGRNFMQQLDTYILLKI